MRVRARLQLLGGNAQDARGFLRADVHGRVLQRGTASANDSPGELRHRAVLPALRHGSKHATLDDHRVEVQLVARAAQQLAFAKLHDAGVYLFQQFETVALGNAANTGDAFSGRMSSNLIPMRAPASCFGNKCYQMFYSY